MEPFYATAQQSRREALLRRRLEERLPAVCVPRLLPDVGGDMARTNALVLAQLDQLQRSEPNTLQRSTQFLCSVITERVRALLKEEARRAQEAADASRAAMLRVQPSGSELLRRRMRAETRGRFEGLRASLRKDDRDGTGALPPSRIRLLCRQFNLESGTLDDILASCYMDARGGGAIQYADLVDRLIAADYPELLEPDAPEAEDGSTTAAGGYGRSHLRRRTDGPGRTLKIRALPTDEWAALSQNNAEIATAYEQQMAESARRERFQYGAEIRSFAKAQKDEEAQVERARKQREREFEDTKMSQYQTEQARLQEAQAQRELEAWQEGQVAIQTKKQAAWVAKEREVQEAKARLAKMEREDEEAYMKQMRKVEQERREWRATQAANKVEQAKREQQVLKEREDDKVRMKLYAEMLEKEHKDRMMALDAALNYQPPASNIRAAEGIAAKARADEQRALGFQRLAEAEALERDMEKEARRKREARENAEYLFGQMKRREELKAEEKIRDKMIADATIAKVKDSLLAEEEAVQRRKDERRRLAAQQREQAMLKDRARSMNAGMSPQEKRINRNLFDQLSANNRQYNAFTETARRVFT